LTEGEEKSPTRTSTSTSKRKGKHYKSESVLLTFQESRDLGERRMDFENRQPVVVVLSFRGSRFSL
jgi:hypothetical protein